MKFGELLREIRKEKKIGQPELSKLSGVNQNAISDIETGKRDPYLATVKKLLNSLDHDIFIGEIKRRGNHSQNKQ